MHANLNHRRVVVQNNKIIHLRRCGRRLTEAEVAGRLRMSLRQLKVLAEMRGWAWPHNELPDDHRGGAFLKAMLACGLEGLKAYDWAPWIKVRQLNDLIAEADAVPPHYWTPERIGELVELTDDEREAGELWSIRPIDMAWSAIQERVHQRRKARNRKRWRKKQRERYMAEQMSRDLDVREESIFVVLDNKWTPASALMAKVAGGRAWRAQHGPQITGPSLRVLVHKNLDRLLARGLIESKKHPGRNGLSERLVRRRDPKSNGNGNARRQTRRATPHQISTFSHSNKLASNKKTPRPRILVPGAREPARPVRAMRHRPGDLRHERCKAAAPPPHAERAAAQAGCPTNEVSDQACATQAATRRRT